MSNPTYTRLAATAARLINSYGREMQLLTREASGTSWNPTTTESETDIIGVVTRFAKQEVDGDLIRRDDLRVILDSTVKPDLSMRLKTETADYSIVDIEEIKPADKSIIYKLQVRL